MGRARKWLARAAGLFGRTRRDRELAAELESHLALHIDDNLRAGMTPEEARRKALIKLGGLEQAKQLYREQRGVLWLEDLWRDLCYGARMLRKSPGFTLVALLSLALGIGVNATIFSFVNALLLRPPAARNPSRLVEFWNCPARSGCRSGRFTSLSFPDYVYYRDHNGVFSATTAFSGRAPFTWNNAGSAEVARGQAVAANFFSVLGVPMAIGRSLPAESDQPGGRNSVIVLSHQFWQRRLAGDRRVIGRTLILDGHPFTVVGVAAADFTGVVLGPTPDFWVPLSAVSIFQPGTGLGDRRDLWLVAVARLRPGLSGKQAQANLAILSRQLQSAFPASDRHYAVGSGPLEITPGPLRSPIGELGSGLLAIVGLVLLIACANVASLMLARAMTREREMAVRAAIGATRAQLAALTLSEALLIALAGAFAALTLSLWAVPSLVALEPPDLAARFAAPLDWRVVIFTFAVSLATVVTFGLAPALRASRVDFLSALRGEVQGSRPSRSRLRNALVIGQVAACALLLTGAGLCLRSLWNVNRIDLGFDGHHEAVARINRGNLGLSKAPGKIFYRQLLSRSEALPGVTAAGITNYLPLADGETILSARAAGSGSRNAGRTTLVHIIDVSPGFFRAMGTTLLQGRAFESEDGQGAPLAAVVNRAMANLCWPGEDPLGRRIVLGSGKESQEFQVVGVVKTVKVRTLSEAPAPVVYRSFLQFYHSRLTLVVRTSGNPRALLAPIRTETQSLDPNVPVSVETIGEYMQLPLYPAHTAALLLGAFALLALVLAVTGLYGVVSYAVSQRAREIGIRVALGASRSKVLGLVLRQGAILTLSGTLIGLAGAWALARFLKGLLYGIPPNDPTTFLTVTVMLMLVALAASYIPARRASRVDPVVALRKE